MQKIDAAFRLIRAFVHSDASAPVKAQSLVDSVTKLREAAHYFEHVRFAGPLSSAEPLPVVEEWSSPALSQMEIAKRLLRNPKARPRKMKQMLQRLQIKRYAPFKNKWTFRLDLLEAHQRNAWDKGEVKRKYIRPS